MDLIQRYSFAGLVAFGEVNLVANDKTWVFEEVFFG
jgi:hypothetical protein